MRLERRIICARIEARGPKGVAVNMRLSASLADMTLTRVDLALFWSILAVVIEDGVQLLASDGEADRAILRDSPG